MRQMHAQRIACKTYMEPLLCVQQGFVALAGLDDTLCRANTRSLCWMCQKGVGTRAGSGRGGGGVAEGV